MFHKIMLTLTVLLIIPSVKCSIVANNTATATTPPPPSTTTATATTGTKLPTRADVITNMFKNYDKYSLPPTENDGPQQIFIYLRIKSIFDISELTSSFTVRYHLDISWSDTRLQFVPFIEKNKFIASIKFPVEVFKDKGKCSNLPSGYIFPTVSHGTVSMNGQNSCF